MRHRNGDDAFVSGCLLSVTDADDCGEGELCDDVGWAFRDQDILLTLANTGVSKVVGLLHLRRRQRVERGDQNGGWEARKVIGFWV